MDPCSPRQAVLLLLILLTWMTTALAQQPVERKADPVTGNRAEEKEALELMKLKLEIAKLESDPSGWLPLLLPIPLGVVTGLFGVAIAWHLAHREQLRELDKAVHDQRLAIYPKLVAATQRLALYFPPDQRQADGPAQIPWLTLEDCAAIGQEMSRWYFTEGGLLLSRSARDAYINLQRALARAVACDNELYCPLYPADHGKLSAAKLKEYRTSLARIPAMTTEGADPERWPDPKLIETWAFGQPDPADESGQPYLEYRDYLFLQELSSRLRTALATDLRGRLHPAT